MVNKESSLTQKILKQNGIDFDQKVYDSNQCRDLLAPEANAKRKILLRFGPCLSPQWTKTLREESQRLKNKWQQDQVDEDSQVERNAQWTLEPPAEAYWKTEDYEPDEVKDEKKNKERHFATCLAIAKKAWHPTRELDSEAQWREFLEREIFKELRSSSSYEAQRHEFLRQVCSQKEVLWNENMASSNAEPPIQSPSHPKPDITYAYPILGFNEDEYIEHHGDDEYLKAFSYGFLKDLRPSEAAGLQSSPTTCLQKRRKDVRSTDLICFPWAVVEFKRSDVTHEPNNFCYCQAANATAKALNMYKMLFEKADRHSIPPVVGFTCTGSEVAVWLTHEDTTNKPFNIKMTCIFATDVRLTWGVMCILHILETAQKEAELFKSRLADYICAIHRKPRQVLSTPPNKSKKSPGKRRSMKEPISPDPASNQQSLAQSSLPPRQDEVGQLIEEHHGEPGTRLTPNLNTASRGSSKGKQDRKTFSPFSPSAFVEKASQTPACTGSSPCPSPREPPDTQRSRPDEKPNLKSNFFNLCLRPKSAEPSSTGFSIASGKPKSQGDFAFGADSSTFASPFSKPFASPFSNEATNSTFPNSAASSGWFSTPNAGERLIPDDATSSNVRQFTAGNSCFSNSATGGALDRPATTGRSFRSRAAYREKAAKHKARGRLKPENMSVDVRRLSNPFATVPLSTPSTAPSLSTSRSPAKAPEEGSTDSKALNPRMSYDNTSVPLSFAFRPAREYPDSSDDTIAKNVKYRKEQASPGKPVNSCKAYYSPRGKRIVVRLPKPPEEPSEFAEVSSGHADLPETDAPANLFPACSASDKNKWCCEADRVGKSGSGDDYVDQTPVSNSFLSGPMDETDFEDCKTSVDVFEAIYSGTDPSTRKFEPKDGNETESELEKETESSAGTDSKSDTSDPAARNVETTDTMNQGENNTEDSDDDGWNEIIEGDRIFTQTDALDLKRDASAALHGSTLASMDEFQTLLTHASNVRLYCALKSALLNPESPCALVHGHEVDRDILLGCNAALELHGILNPSIVETSGVVREGLIEKALDILLNYSRTGDLRNLLTIAIKCRNGFEVINLLKTCEFDHQSKEWRQMDERAFEMLNGRVRIPRFLQRLQL